jgi:hypothetical protein
MWKVINVINKMQYNFVPVQNEKAKTFAVQNFSREFSRNFAGSGPIILASFREKKHCRFNPACTPTLYFITLAIDEKLCVIVISKSFHNVLC